MIWVWAFVAGSLLVISLIAALNSLTFPRLGKSYTHAGPLTSLLIPARDEAAQIGATIGRLLAQDYANFEIIILDDHSSDGTAQIAAEAGKGDPRLRVQAGLALPTGWTGKNWACQQLAELARGDILVFSDADVQWEAHTLAALVASMRDYQADLLTVWPTQQSITWAERLVVPMMMLAVLGYLPEILVRRTRWAAFSAANGQCLVFRREAYQQIGGHAAVQGSVLDDVRFARLTKGAGLRLVMALGAELLSARMYSEWRQVRDGFAKNILAGHGNSPLLLTCSALFHWLVFLAPWVWLGIGWTLRLGPGWPWAPVLMAGLSLMPRLLTASLSGQRLRDGVLMPVSVVCMSVIAWQALWWHFREGGPEWKGRRIQPAKAKMEDKA